MSVTPARLAGGLSIVLAASHIPAQLQAQKRRACAAVLHRPHRECHAQASPAAHARQNAARATPTTCAQACEASDRQAPTPACKAKQLARTTRHPTCTPARAATGATWLANTSPAARRAGLRTLRPGIRTGQARRNALRSNCGDASMGFALARPGFAPALLRRRLPCAGRA
jgi:hypothetical protein